MSRVVELPSGAKLEVRSLTGKESKILSDKDAAKNGTFMDKILSACTVGVVANGPYRVEEGKAFDWMQALLGDRYYAILQIRVASLGELYSFKVQCREDHCRKLWEHEINLIEHLPVQRLSPEAQATFAGGNEFTTVDGNSKTIKYRLPIGKDEHLAAKFKGGFDGAFIPALRQRIISIEGEPDVRLYLERCEWSKLLELLAALDENNCGVKTDIEIECPECGAIQELQLPFTTAFFAPSMKAKKQKT
jgi:hypothetical protein